MRRVRSFGGPCEWRLRTSIISMGNSSGKKKPPAQGQEPTISTQVDNFNLKSKRTNIMEQKLKNARATGLLALQGHKLKEFPTEALAIAKLRTLDLSENSIRVVPPQIVTLQKLKTLKLQDNKLGPLPNLDALAALVSLALDRNGLATLPALPTKLKTLSCAGNVMRGVPPTISTCASTLKVLDLSSNRIELLDPAAMVTLTALEELNLDDNQLLMLPDEMGELGALRMLSARRNRLQALPATMLKQTPIDKMHLEGNSITKKQFMECDGFEEFTQRRELLKKKDIGIAMEMSGMDLCGLDGPPMPPPS